MKNVDQFSSFYPINGEKFRRRQFFCVEYSEDFLSTNTTFNQIYSQLVSTYPTWQDTLGPQPQMTKRFGKNSLKLRQFWKNEKVKQRKADFFSLSGSNLELLERDLSGCSREISLTKFAFLNGDHKLKMSSYEHKRTPLFLSAWKWEISSSLEFLN